MKELGNNKQSIKNIIAIHSVFIAKENILFLEEWIDYHLLIGFNRFYLYDNSKVTEKVPRGHNTKCFIQGKLISTAYHMII